MALFIKSLSFLPFFFTLLGSSALASAAGGESLDLTGHFVGYFALIIFILAYALVMMEEFTHMSVAVAVLSGTVDVGLGIYAAAKALDLDFIPVVTEEYDLVIPQEHFETDNIRVLLDIINSETFKTRVTALGGYDTQKTGMVLL